MDRMNSVRTGPAPLWRIVLTGTLAALAVVMTAPEAALAQSGVEASSAQEFLGSWDLPIQGQQGTVTLSLDLAEGQDGMLEASVSTPDGSQAVEDITRSGETVTLAYSVSAQGQTIPVEIVLTPDGEELDAELDFGGGQFAMSGTATRADER